VPTKRKKTHRKTFINKKTFCFVRPVTDWIQYTYDDGDDCVSGGGDDKGSKGGDTNFWVTESVTVLIVPLCSLGADTNVSEEHAASIFTIEV
jgi:hypothetical protein